MNAVKLGQPPVPGLNCIKSSPPAPGSQMGIGVQLRALSSYRVVNGSQFSLSFSLSLVRSYTAEENDVTPRPSCSFHRVFSYSAAIFCREREREHLIYDNRHRVRRMHGGIDRWNGWFEFQEYRGEYDFTDRMRLSVIPLTTTTSLVTVELQFLRWNYSLSLFLSFSFSLEWNVQFSSDGSIVLVTFSYWWQCWFDKFKEYIILNGIFRWTSMDGSMYILSRDEKVEVIFFLYERFGSLV